MDKPLVLGHAGALAFVTNCRARPRRFGSARYRVDEPPRVLMLGVVQDRLHPALLDDLAPQADIYAVDHLTDDGQVVGDEQVAEPSLSRSRANRLRT